MSFQQFFDFIQERQTIRHKKDVLRLPQPWTKDPILAKYRFCNVRRIDDKCSKHLILWVINNDDLSLSCKIFNILLYRRFNTPNFFSDYEVQLTSNFSLTNMEKAMDEEKSKGNKLFNSAYIICQVSFESEYRKSDKHIQQLLLIEKFTIEYLGDLTALATHGSIEFIYNFIKKLMPLTGGFLAYQYCLDISYIKGLDFNDLNSFTDVGPGAVGTIDLLFGKQKNQKEYMNRCVELYKMQGEYLRDWEWDEIALSDIENCACEFRKYIGLSNPSIKTRKRYYKEAQNG